MTTYKSALYQRISMNGLCSGYCVKILTWLCKLLYAAKHFSACVFLAKVFLMYFDDWLSAVFFVRELLRRIFLNWVLTKILETLRSIFDRGKFFKLQTLMLT